MLPGKNGEDIIKDLKQKNNVPIIVMSAIEDVNKKVDLFSLGANDYITKPFNNDELIARIKGGTGLGLAIAKEFTKQLGGTICVKKIGNKLRINLNFNKVDQT